MRKETTGRSARWLIAIGLFVVSAAMPAPALAHWSGTGAGSAIATAASVEPPTVSVNAPALGDRVHISWTRAVPPDGLTVLGYRVSRSDGHTSVDVCHSSPVDLLPPETAECLDTDLADGDYVYTVTADVGPWTEAGEADPVTVAADRTGPTIRLGGTAESNALIDRRSGIDILFFSPTAAGGGGITLTAEVTDDGVGPESATFPAVTTTRWAHAAETVTTGSGSGATATYVSSPFSFLEGAPTPPAIDVVAADTRGNTTTASLTVVADSTAPTGGALRVNGADASAGGTLSWASGDFVLDAVTPYAETASGTASGLASSVFVRESATLSAGSCGAFGGATEVSGALPLTETGLASGCYRYTLTGTDNVGNATSIQTTVRLDTSAPDAGAVSANGTAALPGGVTSTVAATTWPLTRSDYADADSGITSSTLTRANATLTGGTCGTYGVDTTLTGAPAQTGLTTGCYRYRLVGTNAVGLTSTVEVTVLADTAVPTGGAFAVNGTAATGASPSSNSTTSSVTVSGVVNYTDANIGLASSTLTRAVAPLSANVCGTYGAEIPVTGTGTFTVNGLEDACHRFALRGTDLAGNTIAISRIVKVDASAPTGGALVVNGSDASVAGTRSWSADNAWDAVWSHFTDPQSGVTAVSLVRTQSTLSGGVCSTAYGTTTTYANTLTPTSGTTVQSGLGSGRCYRYILTGRNAFNVSSTLTAIVAEDTVAPTFTGNLTVNGSTTSSVSTTGTYNVTGIRVYADAQSGLASQSFTRTWAPVANGVCGTPDPATTIAMVGTVPIPQSALPVGCYLYTQAATNATGLTTTTTATVRVDSTAPVGGAVTANGAAAANVGTQSYSGTGSWTVDTTPFTDPESTTTNTLARSVATTLSNGTCGTFGTAVNTTITAVTSTPESGFTVGCVRYVLTGRNSLNLTAPTLTTTVRIDTSAPGAGALTVNGGVATAGGSSTVSATGTFTISVRTNYTDTQSGITAGALTRTYGATCATLDGATATTIAGTAPIAQTALPAGCYRYVLSGTNGAGLTSSILTTVTVGP